MHIHTLIYIIFGEGNDFLNETDRHTSLKNDKYDHIQIKTVHQMTP